MTGAVLEISELPDTPLDAAHAFHTEHLADARDILGSEHVLTIALPPAGKDHDDWRRALARDLARAYAPKRINVVGMGGKCGLEEILTYLLAAPGVTGQYLPLDD